MYLSQRNIYGSSRIGTENVNQVIASTLMANIDINIENDGNPNWFNNLVGDKRYELSNHLGNVLAVVTDKKLAVDDGFGNVDYYTPDVVQYADYYPFGFKMPGRNGTAGDSYRYGWNTQESVDEISGVKNHYTAPYWEYDPRVVMRWNTDPKPNPSISPYSIMAGNPIMYTDHLGDSIRVPNNLFDPSKAGAEGYNSEGLNMEDWNTFSGGIQEVSGISLATPSIGDKNLTIQSIDENVGSESARNEFKGLLNHKKLHQNVEITNNDPNVLGAENQTSFMFDKSGNFLGTDYNAGVMKIDLADFRQWKSTNSGIQGTTDPRALGIGFSFLHENMHNRGVGMFGLTKSTLKTFDMETPVINQINLMRQQMGLPNRQGHSRSFDNVGGYLKFDDGTKYYIK